MKLESVYISKFRSIKSVDIIKCGDFNVLIGKNNSGKSSILSAINSFFNCIQDGNVVALNPPIGKEIDFFNKETHESIEITLTFSMSSPDIDGLVQDIVTEAPQMKNAVSVLDPALQIFIFLCITPPPKSFSFVRKISLGKTPISNSSYPEAERVILAVSNDAAVELYENLSSYSQQNSDAEDLSKILSKIIANSRLRREWKSGRESGIPFIYYSDIISGSVRTRISPDLLKELEDKYSEAASFDEFIELVQTLAEKMKEEATKVQEKPLKRKIDTFTGEGNSLPDYAKKLLQRVSEMKVLHLTERRKPIGEEEAERLLSLKVKRGGEEALGNIKETVSSLLGVRIDAFQSESPQGRIAKIAELDVDNFLVEVNGSGIKESLRLVLDVEFGNPNILLVEEPEIHLHPALETSMMRYLKRLSSRCQVFLTTHSTNFLDTAEMQNVYLISKGESTQVKKLNIEEAEAKIPKELGIRLSSVFMFDRLVFVEGQSDEDILRELASTLEINFSQANVGFIPMGGVRNFAHFATEEILSFLTKRQVKMWFLMDRDEKEDSEVLKLQNRLGQKAILQVLRKREIENYLICPRAIIELIKFKRQYSHDLNNNELPTEAEINEKIEKCAEELKQLAIEKRVVKVLCQPIYPSKDICEGDGTKPGITDRVKGEIERIINQLEADKQKVESVYQEQLEQVSNSWKSDKLNMVPGDILIDLVCQEYNVRFKKERDGSRLAAFMKKEEIDQELKCMVKDIGTCI
ncbi:AAA family ATPase [Microcoleus sp. LAD1_D3]|uniref:AAA family ATPase n=1 Tax=Microcoleus sp. LAD1_D3 TaxID=2819365 RepID=UPI002FCF9295